MIRQTTISCFNSDPMLKPTRTKAYRRIRHITTATRPQRNRLIIV